MLRALRDWASSEHGYRALVEPAAWRAADAGADTAATVMILRALRIAPRRALPLRWFLEAADRQVAFGPRRSRARVVRELLAGLVGANVREPMAVAEWRARHKACSVGAAHDELPAWPLQEVTDSLRAFTLFKCCATNFDAARTPARGILDTDEGRASNSKGTLASPSSRP